MALSDMLFSNTHSVEQLVDIKKQKKVDKVLLKVIRTVRSKGNLTGWVKPESNFKTDLKLSDKTIAAIKHSLGEYYNLDLTKNTSLNSAKAIVTYIKTNKPNVADSIFLVNVDEYETDVQNEVQLDNDMVDPNIIQPNPDAEIKPKDPEEQGKEPISPEPLIDNPSDELAVDPTKVEESDPGEEVPETEEPPVGGDISVSTEQYSNPQLKGKMVWTYYTRSKEGIKDKMITVGAGPNSRYICQVFPTKEQLISNQTKGAHAPHTVPYALGIPFNYIKKYLGKRGKMVVINQQVKVPVNICLIDKIPMEKYSVKQAAKENLVPSTEGLSVKPAKAESWADVMNNL